MHVRGFDERNIVAVIGLLLLAGGFACDDLTDIADCPLSPPLRHAIDDLRLHMAGKSQSDEPFAVELSRRLL